MEWSPTISNIKCGRKGAILKFPSAYVHTVCQHPRGEKVIHFRIVLLLLLLLPRKDSKKICRVLLLQAHTTQFYVSIYIGYIIFVFFSLLFFSLAMLHRTYPNTPSPPSTNVTV
ncbi:hypothetical protein F4779DRAFT_354816 [Xylariaceae sp. FL0662B]|nr:hypothetical protein F4779DRAFT_354816 [Xylariaceae sp. FL0662B]